MSSIGVGLEGRHYDEKIFLKNVTEPRLEIWNNWDYENKKIKLDRDSR